MTFDVRRVVGGKNRALTMKEVSAILENKQPNLLHLCNSVRKDDENSWSAVRQWINCNKGDEERFRSAAHEKDEFDNSVPLHEVLRKRPPVDVVKSLIEYAPEALRSKNSNGWLPLHIAVMYKASLLVISILVDTYPESVRVKDNNGFLPLHFACIYGSSLEVLDVLLSTHPDGAYTEDKHERIPSYYLKQMAIYNNCREDMLLLHKAVTGGFSINVIRLLLEAFPESCTVKDENGMIPLHHTCVMNTEESVEIALLLLDCNADCSTITDDDGRTPSPSLYMKQAVSQRDKDGMLPLHHKAAKGLTTNSLKFLFRAYPEGISFPNNYDMLPFHFACLNTTSSLDVLMMFVKLYPESLSSFSS